MTDGPVSPEFHPTNHVENRVIRDGQVLLFRYENPSISTNPARYGDTSHPDLVGRWFTDDPQSLASRIIMRPPGGDIVITQVPEERLEALSALSNPTAENMDIESDNYIVPDEFLKNVRRVPLELGLSGKKLSLRETSEFIKSLVEKEKER